jgi:hypothetical protein
MEFETILGMDTTFNRIEILPDEPVTPSTNLTVNNLFPTSVELGWTPGDGNRHLVVMREKFAAPFPTFVPDDCFYYPTNSEFGAGQDKSGNFVVYGGGGSSVTVTGLTENTEYEVFIYDYNKPSGRVQNYLNVNPLMGSFMTPGMGGARVLIGSENESEIEDQLIMETNFSVYPNPTQSGLINVNFANLEANTPVHFSIHDISGRVVIDKKFQGNATFQIDMNQLSGKGLYLIKAMLNEHQISERIIVE